MGTTLPAKLGRRSREKTQAQAKAGSLDLSRVRSRSAFDAWWTRRWATCRERRGGGGGILCRWGTASVNICMYLYDLDACKSTEGGLSSSLFPQDTQIPSAPTPSLSYPSVCPSVYCVCGPYPLRPSAKPHEVGTDLGSEIDTPDALMVAIWNCIDGGRE